MRTSQPAVARLESHQHDPQLSTLARYVTALGLSLEFVLTDNATGTQVWSSRQGLQPEAKEESVEEAGTAGTEVARYDLRGLKIVDGTWTKVSGLDVEGAVPVLARSAEPGWMVLYWVSRGSQSFQALTSPVRHIEMGEDPRVLGLFAGSEPDPISIAPATSHAKPDVEQALALLAKFRNTELEGVEAGPGRRLSVALNSLLPRIGPPSMTGELVQPAHMHAHIRSAEARIGIEAPDSDVEYNSLKAWLSTEPGLDIFMVGAAQRDDQRDGIEALVVLIETTSGVFSFANALSNWLLRNQAPNLKVNVSSRGHSVQLDVERADDAEPLVRELLSVAAGETSAGT
jgi:hypothetical protein